MTDDLWLQGHHLVRASAALMGSGGVHIACVGGLVCVPRNGECASVVLYAQALPAGLWPLDTPWGRDWSLSQTRFCGLCLAQCLVHCVHHILANHLCPR